MTTKQVRKIYDQIKAEEMPHKVKFVETHISWLILKKDLVYKIKKPLKFSFLDFSTLEQRQHYCQRELQLNRRLAPEMYLDVVSVGIIGDRFVLSGEKAEIIDYALKMKRMDESKQMNLMLLKNAVSLSHMDQLARILSAFHANTEIILEPLDINMMQADFADILDAGCPQEIKAFVREQLGNEAFLNIERAISFSSTFLKAHDDRIRQRGQLRLVVDGHGDLHSGNIFLLEKPVVFDCIEFNDHFRKLDVLDELAFFCMDLDLYDKPVLGARLLQKYHQYHPCLFGDADTRIFQYYKLYRANVKIKVNALKALQTTDESKFKSRTLLAIRYYDLFSRYLNHITTPYSINK